MHHVTCTCKNKQHTLIKYIVYNMENIMNHKFLDTLHHAITNRCIFTNDTLWMNNAMNNTRCTQIIFTNYYFCLDNNKKNVEYDNAKQYSDR